MPYPDDPYPTNGTPLERAKWKQRNHHRNYGIGPTRVGDAQHTNDRLDGTSQDGDYAKTGSSDNAEWGR